MTLWIILDLIVIAIYILSIYFYKSKGFLKSSETIISLILTYVLMSSVLPFFEEFISESSIGESIHSSVYNTIVNPKTPEEEKSEDNNIALPDFMQNALDDKLKDINEAKDNMLTTTAEQTSNLIIKLISVILLFLLVKLGIFLLFRVLELFSGLAPLNFVNRALGIILGIINASIIVYILCAVAVILVPVEYSQTLKEAISRTYLTQFFYNNNFLIKFFL